MQEQEYEFKNIGQDRFVDYMFIKAITKLSKEQGDKQIVTYQNNKKEGRKNVIVFSINGIDLPLVEAFEEMYAQFTKSYDQDVRKDAVKLVEEKIGNTLNSLADDLQTFKKKFANALGITGEDE